MHLYEHTRSHRASRSSGQALIATVFWVGGALLFFAPFLRQQDTLGPEGVDPHRSEEMDIPFDQDVATFESEFDLELAAAMQEAGEEYFGLDSPSLTESGLIMPARVRAGEVSYNRYCVGCHGSQGDGAGPAVQHLNPRPRNFRRGVFKFTSTKSGGRPLRADLFKTITNGLVGSSMPEFSLVAEARRHDLVEYVRYVSMRGEFEQLALDIAWDEEELPDFEEAAEIVFERWGPESAKAVYPSISEPTYDAESVDRGRAMFIDTEGANCASCHGETGAGDGPAADGKMDDWGYPLRPRDLRTGTYRAGDAPADLYRSIATGINGTPMPSYLGAFEPEQIWDMVHFVQSLAGTDGVAR